MDFRSWSNFECIWGHLGGCFNFGLFGTVFGPQKVLLLGKFSRSTSRSWGQGHLIRDKFWSKIFFFGVALLWYFSQGGIDKLCIKGYNWDPCYSAIGSAPRKKIFYQTSTNTLILIFNCKIHGYSLNICSFLKILKFSDFLGPKIAFRMKLKIFPCQNSWKKRPYKSIFPQKIDLVWNKIF